jgi:hypothetical protein
MREPEYTSACLIEAFCKAQTQKPDYIVQNRNASSFRRSISAGYNPSRPDGFMHCVGNRHRCWCGANGPDVEVAMLVDALSVCGTVECRHEQRLRSAVRALQQGGCASDWPASALNSDVGPATTQNAWARSTPGEFVNIMSFIACKSIVYSLNSLLRWCRATSMALVTGCYL